MRIVTMCLVAALAIVVAPANGAVQVNDKTVINLTVFVPCAASGAGESVDLSGPLHTSISFTINGDNVSGHFHFQPQGIRGTGETTGDKYQATGVTQESFKSSLQNGQASQTFVNNFRIIGPGPGNNYLVHENLHFTINANGTMTVTAAPRGGVNGRKRDGVIADCLRARPRNTAAALTFTRVVPITDA